ncbi:MAG: rRNA pseudouridine synthase, partial [Candidatus Omnitrophica bacterium]|nr:rRNA pseudouridine synthase [Candidatus Omnitrophota bacterium]
MKKRLQVVLAQCGVCSRRKAEDFIEKGRVRVNGNVTRAKGFRVDTDKDRIEIDGRLLKEPPKTYFVLNKPKGIVTTASDEKNRITVLDLIKEKKLRIYPVGRLDKDTEGVILLTNDGDLAYRLTHPKFGVKKLYIAQIKGSLSGYVIKKLEKGVYLDGKRTSICRITSLKHTLHDTVLKIHLHEGRKRQIRRMIKKVGGKVIRLRRIEYAGINAMDLPIGRYRHLT